MVRVSRWPVEWLYTVALAGFTLWVFFCWIEPRHLPLHLQFYRNLATAFVSGWLFFFTLSYGDQLLRPVPGTRWWRSAALGVITVAAVILFLSFPSMRTFPVTRLMESFALSTMVAAAALTLFLPVSGLLPARALGRTILASVRQWGPLCSYIVVSGTLVTAVTQSTPFVWDPVLLRMDMSLGFNPSEAIFHWEVDKLWVAPLSNWGYPLLGFLIAGVAARIYANGAIAHARRAVFAILLVGTLVILCYALVPALSPLFAFPELFQTPMPFKMATTADLVREVALTGPRQIPADWSHARNTMPSLHTAFTLVALAAAWNWRRSFFWMCLPLGLLQIITAMTLCVHYLVDIFAAVPFATLCWWLADLGVRHTGPAEERLPSPAFSREAWRRETGAFLASMIVSIGLFLWWAHEAPIPPVLAWPLAAVATILPVAACRRVLFGRKRSPAPLQGTTALPVEGCEICR